MPFGFVRLIRVEVMVKSKVHNHAAPYRPESIRPTLNAGPTLAKSPWPNAQPHSPTSSSMALVGRGRLRLLPLAATADRNFLPRLRCACLLADQESPRPPSSTALRPTTHSACRMEP